MAKQLSKTSQRFSVAAKQVRAAHREAQKVEKEQYQTMLDTTILTPERLAPLDVWPWNRGSLVVLDGVVIAEVTAGPIGVFVEIANGQYRSIQIHNVEACKSLLTYRKIAVANMFPDGSANLAQRLRQNEAIAEAEHIDAVTGSMPVTATQNRL
jgi:hypothetical protein